MGFHVVDVQHRRRCERTGRAAAIGLHSADSAESTDCALVARAPGRGRLTSAACGPRISRRVRHRRIVIVAATPQSPEGPTDADAACGPVHGGGAVTFTVKDLYACDETTEP
jgi:hypothetical protein